MSELRRIETESYAKVSPPSSFGPPPRLEWLSISALRIDPVYQREITLVGRKNIRKIASEFDWSMFSPVMVASIGSDLFAIVDASRIDQARAFRSINSNTTRLHLVQLHHAAAAAGDATAALIQSACAKAGVSIVRFPTQTTAMKPGETMAVATIGKCISKFGEATTVSGLKALVATGGGNPGALVRTVIEGVIEVLADHKEWMADEKRLHAAFDSIVIDDLLTEARTIAARTKGTSTVDQFEGRLVGALDSFFKGKAA